MHGTHPSNWLKRFTLIAAAAAAASFIDASSAHAGYTSVTNNAAEDSQLKIIAHQYGGSWQKVGDDFYSGNMRAMRVDDFMQHAGIMDLATGQCGDATDQRWCANGMTVTAVAKFSSYSQVLSYVDSNGTAHQMMDVKGYGYNIDPATSTMDLNGDVFSWQRSGNSGTQSSLDRDNIDNRDHLITYSIEGLPGQTAPVWMMFWEDLDKTASLNLNRTWADYNDLAVEVRSASVTHPIPLPPAGWAGLITLSGAALVRGRRLISSSVLA